MCVNGKMEHVCMSTYLDILCQEPQWVFLSLRGAFVSNNMCVHEYLPGCPLEP